MVYYVYLVTQYDWLFILIGLIGHTINLIRLISIIFLGILANWLLPFLWVHYLYSFLRIGLLRFSFHFFPHLFMNESKWIFFLLQFLFLNCLSFILSFLLLSFFFVPDAWVRSPKGPKRVVLLTCPSWALGMKMHSDPSPSDNSSTPLCCWASCC